MNWSDSDGRKVDYWKHEHLERPVVVVELRMMRGAAQQALAVEAVEEFGAAGNLAKPVAATYNMDIRGESKDQKVRQNGRCHFRTPNKYRDSDGSGCCYFLWVGKWRTTDCGKKNHGKALEEDTTD